MSEVTRQTMTDDSGLFVDGTVVNEAFVDQIYDQIDDQCHSATNPTQTPAETTDEVIEARGNAASLDARISGVVDDDGNPVPAAGQATETQLARAEGNINLVENSDLEDWAAGATAAPDHYTLSGVGAAIAKTGAGEADTVDLGTGTYAARVTSGGGAAAKLVHEVFSAAEVALYRSIFGRKIGFAIRANVANSNVLRVVIDDGTTITASPYATGSVDDQTLSVVHTISASATKLEVYAEVALGANVAYVGGFTAVFSDVAPAGWNPGWERFRQEILEETVPTLVKVGGAATQVAPGGRLAVDYTDRSVTSASTTDSGWTFDLPANTLNEDGDEFEIVVFGLWTTGSNSGTKRLLFFVGAQSIEFLTRAADTSAWEWVAHLHLIRDSSSTLRIGSLLAAATDAAGASNFNGTQYFTMTTLDFAVANTLKTQLNAGHGSNTVVQKGISVRLVQ